MLPQYFLFTHTIRDASQFHITNTHQAIRSLSETITSASWASNETFPFVTPPIFEVHAFHARVKSGVEAIAYSPLVEAHEVEEWNRYSWDHQGWILESHRILPAGDMENGTLFLPGNITPFIWATDDFSRPPEPVKGYGTFGPIWMVSPPPFSASFINLNTLSLDGLKGLYPVVSAARGTYSNASGATATRTLLSFLM